MTPHLPRSEFRAALNRIGPHSLVAARPEPIGAAGSGVFGFATTDPLAPELERRRFHLLTHHCDHLRLGKAELKLDRLEGRSVFPGHFDNAINILAGKRFHRRSTQECER